MKPFAFLMLLAACRGAPQPEDPVWNKQACDHCKMLVSDRRYASSLIDGRGQRLYFDDVGCMAAYESEHAPAKTHWVRDAQQDVWLDAGKAFFRQGAATPMDYGFSAHAQAPGIDFQQLMQRVSRPREEAHAHSD